MHREAFAGLWEGVHGRILRFGVVSGVVDAIELASTAMYFFWKAEADLDKFDDMRMISLARRFHRWSSNFYVELTSVKDSHTTAFNPERVSSRDGYVPTLLLLHDQTICIHLQFITSSSHDSTLPDLATPSAS